MNLVEALQHIHSARKPILFVGAGFAMLAKNRVDENVPTSGELATRLTKRAGLTLDPGVPLSFAADQARESLKPAEILKFLQQQLTLQELTEVQRRILSLPWRRVYTTNYDNAGELAGRRCLDAAADQAPANPGDYIMLHGSLAGCTPANYYQRLKLGEQLYVAGSHSRSQYHSLLHQDAHESDCVIVIGYSITDPDLANIFYASDDFQNKCFVYSGVQKGFALHRIELIGRNTNRSAAQFVEDIDARPVGAPLPVPAAATVESGTYEARPPRQAARQDLLMFGRLDRDAARTAWSDPKAPAYAISRIHVEPLLKLTGPATALIHAHLGNGKSLIVEQAKFLAAASRSVFTIDRSAGLEEVRSTLIALPDRSVVFYEGDVFFASELQDEISQKGHVFVVVCRTTTLRVAAQKIYSAAKGKSACRTFDANKLYGVEIRDLSALIGEMGFWPDDLIKLSESDRLERLATKYDSSMCAIVLKIFENKQVKDKINETWEKSRSGIGPILDRFFVSSYLSLIDVDIPPYLLGQFQPADYSQTRTFETDIIRVDASGVIQFSNSIVGEYIFGSLENKEPLIRAVVRFVDFLSTHQSSIPLKWVMRRMLRYWNLNRLLHSKTLPEEVLDRVSFIPSAASDPLFWVQYSIAKMENGAFLAAYRFTSTAYDKAKAIGGGFDTFQIDTHAARLAIREVRDVGFAEKSGQKVVAATMKLRQVIERRPDDTYHVCSIVAMMLSSDVNWRHHLSASDWGRVRDNLFAIGDVVKDIQQDVIFAPEHQARELIAALRT